MLSLCIHFSDTCWQSCTAGIRMYFFFLKRRQKLCLISLIKKKRVARLINGKPGKNRYNIPTQDTGRPGHPHKNAHTPPRRKASSRLQPGVIVITPPRGQLRLHHRRHDSGIDQGNDQRSILPSLVPATHTHMHALIITLDVLGRPS
jgi:hypothetical protein